MAIRGGGDNKVNLIVEAITDAAVTAIRALDGEINRLGSSTQKFGRTFQQSASGLQVPSSAIESIKEVHIELEGIGKTAEELGGKAPAAFNRIGTAAAESGKGTDKATVAEKEYLNAITGTTEKVNLAAEAEKKLVALRERQSTRGKTSIDQTGAPFPEEKSALLPVFDEADLENFRTNELAAAKAVSTLKNEIKLLNNNLLGSAQASALAAAKGKQIQQVYQALGVSIEKTSNASAKSTGIFSKMSSGIENLEERINRTGLSFRGLSILLGAGLATGLAGIIRIFQQVGGKVADFIGQEHALAVQTQKTFGDGASAIVDFANTTAKSLGANRNEVLKTTASFELLRRELQFPVESAQAFARALTLISEEAFHTQGGFKNVEEAASAVAAAIGGDEKAFAKLGITLRDLARASVNLFGRLPDQLTGSEKALLAVEVAANKAVEAIRQHGVAAPTIGQIVGDAFKGIAGHVDTASKAFRRAQDDIEGLDTRSWVQKALDAISGADLLGVSLDSLRENIRGLSEAQLLLLRSQARATGNKDAIKAIDDELKKRKEAIAAILAEKAAIEANTNSVELNIEAFRASASMQNRAIDAHKALIRAHEDGARRVVEAQEQVNRAFQDAARKEEDLRIRNTRAAEDAVTRIREAERQFVDAQIEGQRKREDAADRVADARERASRDIRSAQERLEDLDIDHTRRVEDLQGRIREAHRETASAVLEAQIELSRAISFGTGMQINDAQRALAAAKEEQSEKGAAATAQRELQREQEDFARERGRADRELKEARLDATKEIGRAVRDQQRAENDAARQIEKAQEDIVKARREQTRAIEDAERAVRALRIENVRAVEDAIRGVHDAERERDRAIAEATLGYKRLADEIGISTTRLEILIEEILTARAIAVNLEALSSSYTPWDQRGRKGLQHGGPFSAFDQIVVGEAGPELIIPNRSGQVISNKDLIAALRAALSGHGGSGGGNFTIIDNTGNPAAVAAAVESRLLFGVNN